MIVTVMQALLLNPEEVMLVSKLTSLILAADVSVFCGKKRRVSYLINCL